MSRNMGELLQMPDPRALQAGALALMAAFTIHVGRLSDVQYPTSPQLAPELIGAAGGGLEAASPLIPELGQPGLQQEEQLEKGVPPIIQAFINDNTIVINGLRCSGALVRNVQGTPVGALTAAHCVQSAEEGKRNPLVEGADGKEYIVSADPVTLQTGIDFSTLQTVGQVQELIVPPEDDGIDQALAVLPGFTPQEVISAYDQEQLSPEELDHLTPNKTKIWLAGYPYNQNGDNDGNKIRQEFPTTYLGQNLSFSDINSGEEIVAASDKADSNGAICSWGNSGGEGLVTRAIRLADGMKQLVVRSVGNFSVFSSFKALKEKGGSQQSMSAADAKGLKRLYHGYYPHANWRGVNAICGYADEAIGVHDPYNLVYPVTSISMVPAPVKRLHEY